MHDEFVQDNHSRSGRGVLRGMHFQPGQAKLVRCARGAILDVVVDIRPGSPSVRATGRASRSTTRATTSSTCPTASRTASACCPRWPTSIYKVSTYYDPARESGFRFDDPEVGIEWPAELELDVSERDRAAPLLSASSGLGG